MTITHDSFSLRMRTNLLSSQGGLISQDIDHIFMTKKYFVIAEEKFSLRGKINPAQAVIYKMINDFFNHNSFFKILLIYFINEKAVYINPKLKKNGMSYSIDVENSRSYARDNLKDFLNGVKQYEFDEKWTNEVVDGLFPALRDCSSLDIQGGTRIENTFQRPSGLKNIIKNQFSIDWIFVNYCTGYIALFLEKTESNGMYMLTKHEKLLFRKIKELFETRANNNVVNPKSLIRYEFLGFYIIEFENTNPDNGKIWINNKEISKNDFIIALNLNTIHSKNILESFKN